MQNYKQTFFVTLLSLVLTNAALALPVTVNAAGTVTSVTTYGSFTFDGSVMAGSAMTGSCYYDPDTAADLNASEYVGEYSIPSISMAIGNYDFTENPMPPNSAKFKVWKTDIAYLAQTTDGMMSLNNTPLGYAGVVVTLLDLCNASVSGANDDLPTAFPNVSLFTYRNRFEVCLANNFSISGVIDSITVIPEPMTITLFALGTLMFRRVSRH